MMLKKSLVSYTILARSQLYLHNNTKGSNREHRCGASQIPSECQVRMFSQLQSARVGVNYAYLFSEGLLGFYSGVELNYYACVASLFHIGKILINERIFRNLLCIRILFVLGFYGLGLTVRRKSFPFRISWGPHNEQLSATWPFGPSTPFVRPCRIRLLLAHLLSRPFIQYDPSPPIFFLFSCPLTS